MPWIWRIIAIIADTSPVHCETWLTTTESYSANFEIELRTVPGHFLITSTTQIVVTSLFHRTSPGSTGKQDCCASSSSPPPSGAARPPCQHLFPPWGALAPLLLVQSAAAQVRARLPETTSSLSFTLQGWWSQSKGRKRRRESQNDRHNVIASRVLSDPSPIIVYPCH